MGKQRKLKSVDPFLSGPRKEKLDRLKRKKEAASNIAPEDPDNQPMPKSFQRMMESIEEMNKPLEERMKEREARKQEKKDRNEKHKSTEKHRSNKEDYRTNVKKLKNESNKTFLSRVITSANRDIEDHKVKILLDGEEEEKKKTASKNKKMHLQLLHKRMQYKKIDRRLDKMEKEFFEDKIAFGEVARRPPQLTSKPRGGKAHDEKSGKRQLHLNSLLSKSSNTPDKKTTGAAGKFKKRKAMTLYEQKCFDEKQMAAVKAYRKVKQQRYQNVQKNR